MPHLASVLCCAACHPWGCVDGSGSLTVKFLLPPAASGARAGFTQQTAHYTALVPAMAEGIALAAGFMLTGVFVDAPQGVALRP